MADETEPAGDQPVVDRPDSVTHFSCPGGPWPGRVSHHIVDGKCIHCKVKASDLRKRYRL